MKAGFMQALLIGAVSGAVIGLLFAPDKGSKTREKFLKKTKDLADDARHKISGEAKDLKGKMKEVKNQAEQRFGSGYEASSTMGS